jgi:two-component system, cell cycle sensor histidine kinase and response regulator CckA
MSLPAMSMPREPIDAATFQRLVEELPTALWLMDEHWVICFANAAAEELLAYPECGLEGLHIDSLVPVTLRGQYQGLRERQVQAAVGGQPWIRGERLLLTRDGREIPVQLTVARIELGRKVFHLGSFGDISQTKQIELETIEQLQSIVDHSDAGIFLLRVTADGEFFFDSFNPNTERWTGLPRDQARGRSIEQVVPAEEAERVRANYRRCVEQGTPLTYEEAPGPISGNREFRTTLVPIRNAAGRVHRLIGISRDVTQQKRVESQLEATRRSLEESEQRFARVFRVSPQPIGITELETGRLVEVNDAFTRVFGHPREQALGRTTLELGMWSDPSLRDRMVEQVQTVGSFRDLATKGTDSQGRLLTLLLSGEVIELAGERCLVTYVHDVSERHRDKRALAESQEKFAKAFHASPDAMAILHADDAMLLEVNEGFVRLSGYARERVIGHTAHELGLWADERERDRAAAILRAQGSVRDFSISAMTASGEMRDCLLSGERIEIEGRACVVATIRDITESRKIERANAALEAQLRQAQKMDALGTLAGGIAHDFNNILGAMLAYTELIKLDINVPTEIEGHLLELGRAAERAKELVRQILTFSRRQAQHRAPIRLERPVRDALNLLRASLPATLRMETQLESPTPAVLADVTQIHQVLMNLGTNAAYAMRDRPGQLGVSLTTVTVDEEMAKANGELQVRRYVRIRVTDTGDGMSQETQRSIFDPFFTTKPMGEGTGLGLAVVHGIVRDHEGAILVDSEVGRGSCFDVYFPEYDVELSEPAPPKSKLARGNGQRILFVDDELSLCRSVGRLLERLGYKVSTHNDALEALECFRAEPKAWDAVLTDLTMPGLTGLELAREVRSIEPNVPIVVMSGFSGTWNAESIRAQGVTDLIAKPLSTERLSEVLAKLFGAVS